MKPKRIVATILLLALWIAAGAARAADAAPVRVYDPGELSLDGYTVIQRLWTGTWWSAFWISSYDEVADAVESLTSKAASLGADGVTNLECVDNSGSRLCYALAIKLKERWTAPAPALDSGPAAAPASDGSR